MDLESLRPEAPPLVEQLPMGRSVSRSSARVCFGLWGKRECRCCGPVLPGSTDLFRSTPAGTVTSPLPFLGAEPLATADDVRPASKPGDFVDTHCHLEEVLQAVKLHSDVPSLSKDATELTTKELQQWAALGFNVVSLDPRPRSSGSADPGVSARPADATASAAAGTAQGGADDGAGGEPTRKRPRETIWQMRWVELSTAEQQAAESLGWTAKAWDSNQWKLPRGKAWDTLPSETQRHLGVLGQSAEVWDDWNCLKVSRIPTTERDEAAAQAAIFARKNWESKYWDQLSTEELAAAEALGFTERTFNLEEQADLTTTINELFGAGFQACITQGCDVDSIDPTRKLCLAHPKVFASFGCHPKGAATWDGKLEERLLSAVEECGKKVVAWGEFGLDYSHTGCGKLASYRREQLEVYDRQLELAIGRGFPLVIHSRGADRDTLRVMRRRVPREWKVHMHCYRGSVQGLETMLAGWRHVYIGFGGLLTMNDDAVLELCKRCPLERLLLETDAPYLPIDQSPYSHPGQIPILAAKVANVKGCSVEAVFEAHRANTFVMYGI